MEVTSKDLNERGYARCCVCGKTYFISDLKENCEICHRWFCRKCSRPTPKGHGFGVVCKNCYTKMKKEDREERQRMRKLQK